MIRPRVRREASWSDDGGEDRRCGSRTSSSFAPALIDRSPSERFYGEEIVRWSIVRSPFESFYEAATSRGRRRCPPSRCSRRCTLSGARQSGSTRQIGHLSLRFWWERGWLERLGPETPIRIGQSWSDLETPNLIGRNSFESETSTVPTRTATPRPSKVLGDRASWPTSFLPTPKFVG